MNKKQILTLILVLAFMAPVLMPVASAFDLDPGDGGGNLHFTGMYDLVNWHYEKDITIFRWWPRVIMEDIWLEINDLSITYEFDGSYYTVKSVDLDLEISQNMDFWCIHNWDLRLEVSDNTLLERYQTTWYVGDTSQDEQFSQSLNIRKTYCTVELDIVIHCYTTYTQEYFDLIYKARLFNPSEDWRTGHWEEAGGVYNPEWIDMWVTIWTAINPTFPDPPK